MRLSHLFIAVSIAVLSTVIGRFLQVSEVLKVVDLYGPTDCIQLASFQAPEDVQVIPGTRYLLMGVDDRVAMWATPGKGPNDAPKGGIAALKLPENRTGKPEVSMVEIENWPEEVDFHPHGLYIRGASTLYVINHAYAKGGERVEVMDISLPTSSPPTLTYRKSLLLPAYLLGITNDLVAVSDSDVYLTTWRSHPDPPTGRIRSLYTALRDILEAVLGLEWSYLYHCTANDDNSTVCTPVTSGISMNGVTIRNNTEIWVIDAVGKTIKRLFLDKNMHLTEANTIPLPHIVDNIDYDPVTDKIYMAVLARGWDFAMFVQKNLAGERVRGGLIGGCDEFDPKTGEIKHVVMQEKENGVSSCVKVGGMMVMGSWEDANVLICPGNDEKIA